MVLVLLVDGCEEKRVMVLVMLVDGCEEKRELWCWSCWWMVVKRRERYGGGHAGGWL